MSRSGVTTDSSTRQLSQNISSEGIHPLPSLHNTPIRLKENGQVLNLLQQTQYNKQSGSPQMLPMPNICGDLPPTSNIQQYLPTNSQTDQTNRNAQLQQQHQLDQQHNHHHHHQQQQGGHYGQQIGLGGGGGQSSTLPSNKRNKQQQHQQQRNPLGNFELSMPDAILAAAMMLNYRQNNASQVQGGGVDPFFGHKSMSGGKRSSLNMKEQLLLSAGIGVAAAANSANCSSSNTLGGGVSGGSLNTTTTNNLIGTPINPNLLLNSRAGVVVGNLQGNKASSSGYNGGGGESTYTNVNNINGSSGGGSVVGVSPNVIQFDFESSSGGGGNGKTVPRPPKRHTPTVKFSPDTFSSTDGSICSGGTVLSCTTTNISCGSSPQTSTLLGSQSHGIIHPGGIISATTSSSNGGGIGSGCGSALNISPANLPPPPLPQLGMANIGSMGSNGGGGSGSCSSSGSSSTATTTTNATQLKSSLKKVSNYSSGSSGSGPGVPEELNV